MGVETLQQHEALIQSLMDPERWPAGGGRRQRIDTHISTVVLAGHRAYKIKKPLDLGFLDFVTLDNRHKACEEELRLNRRLAPDVYLAVCAITGSIENPRIAGRDCVSAGPSHAHPDDDAPPGHHPPGHHPAPVIDWAVVMRRFDPDAILSDPGVEPDTRLIDELAARVGAFHAAAAVCDPQAAFGSPDVVAEPMKQNFIQIRVPDGADAALLARLKHWTLRALDELTPILAQRKANGFVRECHGDLHLGNIALIDGQPVVFDAIEFNAGLRWIDTISDAAFLTMDLHHRGLSELAYRFLDGYLQHSGDYAGTRVIQLYQVYRAMVRAKIAAIRAGQDLPRSEKADVAAELSSYLRTAAELSEPRHGAVVITHGVSGSGKSTVAAQLPGVLPAIRIRSDIERKRLLNIDPTEDATGHGAYTASLTGDTYSRLAESAAAVARSGYIALVDATFLKAEYRDRFAALAQAAGVAFAIIDCDAPPDLLRARIRERRKASDNVSDADLQVLERQLQQRDRLTPAERGLSVTITPDLALDVDRLLRLLQS